MRHDTRYVLGREFALLLLDAVEEFEANHVQQSLARGELCNLVLAELCCQLGVARQQVHCLLVVCGAYTFEHFVPGHFSRICCLLTSELRVECCNQLPCFHARHHCSCVLALVLCSEAARQSPHPGLTLQHFSVICCPSKTMLMMYLT